MTKNPGDITLSHAFFRYPDAVKAGSALEDITAVFPKGSFTAIVGPSGCGKSTLLRLISGIVKADQGEVATVTPLSMVFQGGALLPWRTVEENVRLALESADKEAVKKHASVESVLELLGISHLKDKRPRELSGGQRQRVGIARALVVRPQVLLLDEPFSALDAETTAALEAEILKIWQKAGMTVIMVSHSIESAVSLSDRVIVMKEGRIAHTLDVSLPRPREEGGPEILALAHKVRRLI